MKSFALKENFLKQENKELLSKIEHIFDKLPERTFSGNPWIKGITCHHLAHALAGVFPEFKAVDGHFIDKWREHSRLEEKRDEKSRKGYVIIDPYPIGGIKPQMYYTTWYGNSWKSLYLPATSTKRMHEGLLVSPEFKKQVKLIQKDILKILNDKYGFISKFGNN